MIFGVLLYTFTLWTGLISGLIGILLSFVGFILIIFQNLSKE
ncbi:Uncharacterised protein [Staphylococcus argenteus]|nr:Uncharacterised protein [Staphylococcus argenteus]SHC57511.1 Uncharacterised protein [Staphylococcus argenteus]